MYTQYIYENSPIHRLSAIAKLYGLLLFILAGFPVRSLPAATLYLLAAVFLLWLSRLPVRNFLRRIRHISLLLVIGLIFNLIFTDPANALTIFFRLSAVVLTGQVVLMSTSSEDLIDGLERGFRMKSEHVITIMIAIAFIPILEAAREEIVRAQSSRGYDWNECGLRDKLKGLSVILIPLFRFSLKKAEKLGEALTMKGYQAGTDVTGKSQAVH